MNTTKLINKPHSIIKIKTVNSVVTELSKDFKEITAYDSSSIIGNNISYLFKLLKLNIDENTKEIEPETNYFLFTKSLAVIIVNIQVDYKISHKLYTIKEVSNCKLDDKFAYLYTQIHENFAPFFIFSAPDLKLLKASQLALNELDIEYNSAENAYGKSLCELIPSLETSHLKYTCEKAFTTGKCQYFKESRYKYFKRGITYWDATLTPIKENGNIKYLILRAEDVTEKVESRRLLEQQNKTIALQKLELEKTVKSLSETTYELDKKNLELHTIINNMSGYLMVFDKEGNYILRNKIFYNDTSDNIRQNISENYKLGKYFDLDGNELIFSNSPFQRVLNGEKIIEQVILMKTSLGEKFIKVSGSPLFDDNNNFLMGILCVNEISELKNRNNIIKKQKDFLEAIIHNMSDGIVICDKDLNITFLNSTAKAFFNNSHQIKKVQDIRKFNQCFDGIDGSKTNLADLPIFRVFTTGKFNDYRLTLVHPNKKIYVSINGNPIYDENGNVESAVLCIRDISEQVINEKQLIEQKLQLEAVIENMSDALFIINPDGTYRYFNKRATDMAFNSEKIEKHGDSYVHTKYYTMDGKVLDKDNLPGSVVLKGEKLDNLLLKAIRPDKIMYLSFNGKPYYDDRGNLLHATICIRDMTEYVNNEQSIIEMQQQLLNSERNTNKSLQSSMDMKDEFLSLISHELRTPLNVISSALQAMQFLCGSELSNTAKKYLGMIRQNTFRQLRLVNNLLDITRANAGKIKISKRNIDIVFMTKSIIDSVRTYALAKEIQLRFICEHKAIIIGTDEEKYERILLNLLSNAIKFTPNEKCIDVMIGLDDHNICIAVKDNGIGIPADKINSIFERFEQVDSSLSRQAEGTGIGLSLVKRFASSLGGSISLESKIGKGSTFTLLLPNEIVYNEEFNDSQSDLLGNHLVEITNVEFSDIYM